ncbi:P-type DNA transfer ATPase VirB11 [Massilia soli]|uniref:P-type DNA transfer ATPase VirB11 n=1 Tax=Massilia soli TaxID=2792854 RepID=A0ABS7SLT4_9BURK|nr:P-type DNA transfer ATPase VirB11 [Massilia soli]MBZ2207142.1 P-type DNA transfer ATPase VirB11 [Massilia soli]
MTSAPNRLAAVPGDDASLRADLALNHFLAPLQTFLALPGTTEVCINKPGQVVVQREGIHGWLFHDAPQLDFTYCERLAQLIATYSAQRLDEKHPMLSATLPGGQRCRIVRPPATLPGTISFTIRQPSSVFLTLDAYEQQGAFAAVVDQPRQLSADEAALLDLKRQRRYRDFIDLAVQSRQNIIVSGATGSGKTTFARAIVARIPAHERLLSIENVDELKLRATHDNSVALFYSGDGQGLSEATPQSLMQSSLRQKPDRVFLAELISGNEAYYFMDTVSSGHPGSITTMHAESPRLCIERLISLIRRSDDGRTMSTADIRAMVHLCIDIVIQFKVVQGRRVVTEIYYEPEHKKSLMA